MIELKNTERKYFEMLKNIYIYSNPEKNGLYFISGSSINDKNKYGLPKIIQICPQMGVDWSVSYLRKNKKNNIFNKEKNNFNEIEEKQYIVLKKLFNKINDKYENLYFICGDNGKKDINGLPTEIYLCNSDFNHVFKYIKTK